MCVEKARARLPSPPPPLCLTPRPHPPLFSPTPRPSLAALRVEKDTLLEMLGEKDEELEALRGDLEDVKEAFRVQVDLLLERLVGVSGSAAAAAAAVAAPPQGVAS